MNLREWPDSLDEIAHDLGDLFGLEVRTSQLFPQFLALDRSQHSQPAGDVDNPGVGSEEREQGLAEVPVAHEVDTVAIYSLSFD